MLPATTRGLAALALAAALITASAAEKSEKAQAPPEATPGERSGNLNLLGKTDSATGESRRNENVYFNLIDNNAIKEMNVRVGATATITNPFLPDRSYFGAEFGNKPSGTIHVEPSKFAGLHGSLRFAHSNSVLSARSFFQVGSVLPARENNLVVALGAPLWRGAYLNVDGSVQRIGGNVNGNVLVPLPYERIPLATDPETRSIVERFLSAYPRQAPNRTDINERMLNTNAPQTIHTSSASGALSQSLGSRDRLHFRYLLTSQDIEAFQLVAGQNPDTRTHAHTSRLTWTREFSPTTTALLSAGFDRVHSLLTGEPNAVGPSVSIGQALAALGPDTGIPIDRVQNNYRYAAFVRQVRSLHSWTAGADLARRQTNGAEVSSHRGVFYFRNDFGRDAITNLRMGIPSRFSAGIGDTHRGFRQWAPALHAGDTWRVTPDFTVNYGVRWEPQLALSEVNGLTPVPYEADWNNVAPRLGLAWRAPSSWGVVRAAYGTHFGEVFPTTFQQLRWNPPNVLKFEVQAPSLTDPMSSLPPGALDPNGRSTVFVVPEDLRTPYAHQYNFSWEPTVHRDWKLQLGYVGSRSPKLLFMWHNNRAVPVPGVPQTTATITERRPDPNHHEVRAVTTSSRGYYDAARITLLAPRWRGLTVEASYWFSKAVDLGANYTNTAAGDDAKQGRSQSESPVSQDLKGLSTFDQPHAFLARAQWRTPSVRWFGAWDLSFVALAKNGTPFSVMTGSDGPGYGNVDGASGDRPNVVDPSVLGRTIGHPDESERLLPRSAFSYISPTDSRGSLGSNTFRRGAIRNINAALARTWNLGHDRSLMFRAESINLTNTPQFAEPGYELTSPSFGFITNTLNDGRAFQFSMRFGF